MDNASIHHVEEVTNLIEGQCGAKFCFLPPYSPDLVPAEGQVKSIMKENYKLFQVCTAPRALILNGVYRELLWSHFKMWICLVMH